MNEPAPTVEYRIVPPQAVASLIGDRTESAELLARSLIAALGLALEVPAGTICRITWLSGEVARVVSMNGAPIPDAKRSEVVGVLIGVCTTIACLLSEGLAKVQNVPRPDRHFDA